MGKENLVGVNNLCLTNGKLCDIIKYRGGMKMYSLTITFLSGGLEGMTVNRLSDKKLECGKTYIDQVTLRRYIVNSIEEV